MGCGNSSRSKSLRDMQLGTEKGCSQPMSEPMPEPDGQVQLLHPTRAPPQLMPEPEPMPKSEPGPPSTSIIGEEYRGVTIRDKWLHKKSASTVFIDAPRLASSISVVHSVCGQRFLVHCGSQSEGAAGNLAAFAASLESVGPWEAPDTLHEECVPAEGVMSTMQKLENSGIVGQQCVGFRVLRGCTQTILGLAVEYLFTSLLRDFCHPVLMAIPGSWNIEVEVIRATADSVNVDSVRITHTRQERHSSAQTSERHFRVTWQLVLLFDGTLGDMRDARVRCIDIDPGENMAPDTIARLNNVTKVGICMALC